MMIGATKFLSTSWFGRSSLTTLARFLSFLAFSQRDPKSKVGGKLNHLVVEFFDVVFFVLRLILFSATIFEVCSFMLTF